MNTSKPKYYATLSTQGWPPPIERHIGQKKIDFFSGHLLPPKIAIRRRWTIGSTSSIFEGCTVRFACFCNTRRVLFSPRNTPRQHFFTFLTNSWSETKEKSPRALQKKPQNSPLEPSEAPGKGSQNWTPRKVTFCGGHSPEIYWFRALDPGNGTPVIYR